MAPRIVRVTVDTGFIGAGHEEEVELPENWDKWTKEEQEEFKTGCIQTAIENHISGYAEIVDLG